MSVEILIGDCRERLKELADGSVNCCVTSPPYFGLRDYGHEGQMGLEPTPDEFVAGMVEVFREVRRVLRDDGTLWLNIGDSYYGAGQRGSQFGSKAEQPLWKDKPNAERGHARGTPHPVTGLKFKDLIGIPWMLAFALRADGWYLRQDIIWSKPNPMPESVRDRCTKAHEYLFLLSKGSRYYYDAEAIAEKLAESSIPRLMQNVAAQVGTERANGGAKTNGNFKAAGDVEKGTRNKRSVWEVATQPFSEAHFATYPPALIEPCILAGCPKECCAKCGAPWAPVMERSDEPDTSAKGSTFDGGKTGARDGGDRTQPGERFKLKQTGYAPSCDCHAARIPGTVLDPFGGAGTTGLVADRLQRNAVLCELNPEYAEIARNRIAQEAGMFGEVKAA